MTSLRPVGFALVATLLFLVATATPATAATPGPHWAITSDPHPTNFSANDTAGCEGGSNCDSYRLIATNTGSQPTSGPVTITDQLPAGLDQPSTVFTVQVSDEIDFSGTNALSCTVSAFPTIQCAYGAPVPPGAIIEILINVEVSPSTTGPLENTATVSGGGAPDATAFSQNAISPSPALFGLASFGFAAAGLNGAPDPGAAGHPYALSTRLTLPTDLRSDGIHPVADPKDVSVDLPAGFLGNPQATPRCPLWRLVGPNGTSVCPVASKVGEVEFETGTPGVHVSGLGSTTAIYNMAPEGPYPAEFGFGFLNNPVFLYASLVHTGEGYRVRVTAPDIPRLDVEGTTLRLFGDPVTADGGSTPFAFFTNPTDCTASPQALTATIHADSWQNQASVPLKPDGSSDFSKANFADPAWATATQTLPQPTDCDQLSFNPTFALTPDTTQADSPTGPSVDLKVPQVPPDPTVLATPPLRDATVALPASLSANPSLADGLQGCTEAQIALDTTDPASCPDASKIGTAEVTTPLLPDPVQGQVFLGAPDCSPCTNADAQSGRLLKLYIQADQPETGVVVKLPGTVSADPSTGQLTAAFKNNPQLPFSDLKLQFKTGSRAPLRTPPTCGTYTTTTDLKPWSAPQTPDATPSSSFDVTSGPGGSSCSQTSDQRPLSPSFSAGTLSPVAGAFSPFIMKLTREDGQQEFSSLNVSTPPGIAADLRGVPYCPEAALAAAKRQSGAAEQANPSCPAASQIGTTTVGAGAGPDPYYVPGKVYLAGPYKGAPLSLAIVTPALAGPFDLGTVVVRAATYVDPTDAHLRVVSDPLPKILAGIPLDIRDVRVNIDKPHFTNNPTDCEPMSLFADVFGSQGAATRLTNRFQVGDCGALTFKPKLALSLKGGTARASHPALKATLTMKPGEANIAAAQVTLPHSEFLDQSHIGTVCTRVQFAAGAGNGANCPPASVYGHARAITPLLDKPLEGPVYLRSSTHKLPDLIVALGGQISVDLAGRVDTGKGGGIRNSFEVVPDAPVSKFTLTMKGGAKGLLVNSENICAKPHRAIADFSGQNGKVDDFRPVLQPLGCKHGKGKGGKRHKRAARTR